MQKLNRFLEFWLCLLPLALFFSYFPVISLGSSNSMNFELSLPLLWLVVFDVLGFVMMVKKRILFRGLEGRWWLWLLFPVWVSLSVIWSLNIMRGVLTVGILWLIYFAGYTMWGFRKLFDEQFRVRWWRWFFGSALLVCVGCVVQCVLDFTGVSQDYSLMCDGCTYHMFGFPHPNGFAIEPQFMGNLLIAPVIVSIYLFIKDDCNKFLGRRVNSVCRHERKGFVLCCGFRKIRKVLLPILFLMTLFLTFSRGAIYALVVGLLFVSGFVIFRAKKKERINFVKRVGMAWGLVILSFVVTMNLQGLMAEVGPTSDTYGDGLAKVLNHLSLGIIDIRGERTVENSGSKEEKTERGLENGDSLLVENSEEKGVEEPVENSKEEAIFDGYVTESTDTRMRLTGAALKVWSGDVKTVLFGVGLGGAGMALYNNDLSVAPKEIVQNEYASLLLEIGLIGVSLFVLTMVLVVRVVWKNQMRGMILGLLVAYGVSLVFFSGLPNALQIYLLPMMLVMLWWTNDYDSERRKKLVS